MNMNLTTKNLTNINKVATEVHRKYVAGTHVGELFSKEKCGKKYSKEDVENMICLYIYGVYGTRLGAVYAGDYGWLCKICRRDVFRNLNVSFQKSKKKIRGKMVFEYDKEKVIEHFNNMSKELQSLSNGVLLDERLVMVTNILKSEMY